MKIHPDGRYPDIARGCGNLCNGRRPSTSDNEENEMSRGMPSMVALLGLLAVAGYQNREKIAEMLGGRQESGSAPGQQNQQGAQGGVLGNLGGLLGGATAGSVLSGGLRDLVKRFKQSGQTQAADSW